MNYQQIQLFLLLLCASNFYASDLENLTNNNHNNSTSSILSVDPGINNQNLKRSPILSEKQESKTPQVSSRYLFKTNTFEKPKNSSLLSKTLTTTTAAATVGTAVLFYGFKNNPSTRASFNLNNDQTQKTIFAGLTALTLLSSGYNYFKLRAMQTEIRRDQESQRIRNLQIEKNFQTHDVSIAQHDVSIAQLGKKNQINQESINSVKAEFIIEQEDKDLLKKRIDRSAEVLQEELTKLQAQINQSGITKQVSRMLSGETDKEITTKIDSVQSDLQLINDARNNIEKNIINDTVVTVATQMRPIPKFSITRMFGLKGSESSASTNSSSFNTESKE